MIAATIFLVLFVMIAGVVMFLSKTIDHGEARFDSEGKVIRDDPAKAKPKYDGPARPAQKIVRRLDTDETPKTNGTKDDE